MFVFCYIPPSSSIFSRPIFFWWDLYGVVWKRMPNNLSWLSVSMRFNVRFDFYTGGKRDVTLRPFYIQTILNEYLNGSFSSVVTVCLIGGVTTDVERKWWTTRETRDNYFTWPRNTRNTSVSDSDLTDPYLRIQ